MKNCFVVHKLDGITQKHDWAYAYAKSTAKFFQTDLIAINEFTFDVIYYQSISSFPGT